jgi:trans-aconitate 2-methyltransferase
MPTSADAWDPAIYERFKAERTQPFLDLVDLVECGALRRAVDLGCGTGELTVLGADRLGIESLTGIDNSDAMLADAHGRARPDVRFEQGDIAAWTAPADVDLVLANAALQWIPDHPAVLSQWTAGLAPGGQIAVQVPANADHPSHSLVATVAEERFAADFPDGVPVDPVVSNVLPPEQYATLLYELGYERQHVRLQVYGHVLASSAAVVEWVSGTTLTRIRSVLPADRYAEYVDEYRRRLLAEIGDRAPYFYAFKRILLWGRLPG